MSANKIQPKWYDLLCSSDEKTKFDNLYDANGKTEDVGYDTAITVKLNKSRRYKTRSLLDDYPPDTLTNQLLVNVVTPDKRRLFTIFPSHLDFVKYQIQLDPNKRWFFETILGDRCQKPHFDIDVDIEKNPDIKGGEIVDNLVDVMLDILSEADVEINIYTDVLIFNSHGEKKRSYHVVIDHYMHLNNLEAKAFYVEVVARMDPELSKFVDHAVYSTKQQFRIAYSQKPNSGRVKMLMEKWIYHDEEIEYQYTVEPRDDSHKMLLQLEASLVTHIPGCLPLPNFIKVDNDGRVMNGKKNMGKADYFDEDVSKDLALRALKLLAETAGLSITDVRFPYRLLNISGGIISLRRVHASKCRVCNRVHENENPYLFVIGVEHTVFFNCRRSSKNWMVGKLGKDENGESDEDSESDESEGPHNANSKANCNANRKHNAEPEPKLLFQAKVSENTLDVVSSLATSRSSSIKPVRSTNVSNKEISSAHLARILQKMEDTMPWPD